MEKAVELIKSRVVGGENLNINITEMDKIWWNILDYLWDTKDLPRMMPTCKRILELIQLKHMHKLLVVRKILAKIYGDAGCRRREESLQSTLSWPIDPFEVMMVEQILITDYGSFHLLGQNTKRYYERNVCGARMLLGTSKNQKRFAILNYFREHPNVYWVSIIGGEIPLEEKFREEQYRTITYEKLKQDGQLVNLEQALEIILYEYNHGGQI